MADASFAVPFFDESYGPSEGAGPAARRRLRIGGNFQPLPEAYDREPAEQSRAAFRTATRLLSAAAAISLIQGLPTQRLTSSAQATRGAGAFARIAPRITESPSPGRGPWTTPQDSSRPRPASVQQEPAVESGSRQRGRSIASGSLPFDFFDSQDTETDSPAPAARFSRMVTSAHSGFTPAGIEARLGSADSTPGASTSTGMGSAFADDVGLDQPYARAAALPTLLAHVRRIIASITGERDATGDDSAQTRTGQTNTQTRSGARRVASDVDFPERDSRFPMFDRLASAFDSGSAGRARRVALGDVSNVPLLTRDPAAMASGAVLNPVFVSLIGPETGDAGAPSGTRGWGRRRASESSARQGRLSSESQDAWVTEQIPQAGRAAWPFANAVWGRFTRRRDEIGGDSGQFTGERTSQTANADRSTVASDGFRGSVTGTQPTWAAFTTFVRKLADRAGIGSWQGSVSADRDYQDEDGSGRTNAGRTRDHYALPTLMQVTSAQAGVIADEDIEATILAALQPRLLSLVQRSLRDLLPHGVEPDSATGPSGARVPDSAFGFPTLLRRVLALPAALIARQSSGLPDTQSLAFADLVAEGRRGAAFLPMLPASFKRGDLANGPTPFVQRLAGQRTLASEALRRHEQTGLATAETSTGRATPSRTGDDLDIRRIASRSALSAAGDQSTLALGDLAGDVETAVRHLWDDIPQRQQIIKAAVQNLPMPDRYTPDVTSGAIWPDGRRRAISALDTMRREPQRPVMPQTQTVRPLAMALPVPASQHDQAAEEAFAIQRVETGGQSAAASPSEATQKDTNLASQEKGAAANDVHLLANEVWSLLKRRMETEAERSGRR